MNLFVCFKFIYFWLCWVFVAVSGISLVAVSGGYSSLRFAGFSLRWLLRQDVKQCRHQAEKKSMCKGPEVGARHV